MMQKLSVKIVFFSVLVNCIIFSKTQGKMKSNFPNNSLIKSFIKRHLISRRNMNIGLLLNQSFPVIVWQCVLFLIVTFTILLDAKKDGKMPTFSVSKGQSGNSSVLNINPDF